MRKFSLSIILLMISINSYGQASKDSVKYEILRSIIDTISKINTIHLNEHDSSDRIDIVVDYSSSMRKLSGDIMGWGITFDSLQYTDSNLYVLIQRKFKTDFVHVGEPNDFNKIHDYINSQISGNVFNRRTKELNTHAAIIVGQPILVGWQPLDILIVLTDPNGKNRGDEYTNRYKQYRFNDLFIPVAIVKSNMKSTSDSQKSNVKQFLIEYTVDTNSSFDKINFKLKKIISLGKLW